MKILFVNAINIFSEVQTRYANLGLGYLAALLRQAFGAATFDFKIIDRNVLKHLRKSFVAFLAGIAKRVKILFSPKGSYE